LPDVHGV
jgi:hypothetical protein